MQLWVVETKLLLLKPWHPQWKIGLKMPEKPWNLVPLCVMMVKRFQQIMLMMVKMIVQMALMKELMKEMLVAN